MATEVSSADGNMSSPGDGDEVGRDRPLTPAAQRALAEAAERRAAAQAQREAAEKELGGRDGPDPVRYGDWEKDGIISDF
jgi:hypothetical protein